MQYGFDPYRKWLGIRTAERPLSHYQLLGLGAFEDDVETISHAADQRMTYVRTLAVGDYIEATQKLLNELAAAKVCLLNPEKKAAYDRQLRARAAEVSAPMTSPPRRPLVSPPGRSVRMPTPAPAPIVPRWTAEDAESPPLPLMPDLPPMPRGGLLRSRPLLLSATSRRSQSPSARGLLPLAALAGLLAAIVLVAIWVVAALRNPGGGDTVKVDPGRVDPPQPKNEPHKNQPPTLEIRVEPTTPQEGGSLTIQFWARDPEDDPVQFAFRLDQSVAWELAPGGRVLLANLKPGPLALEARAQDSAGNQSAVVKRTLQVKPAPPPPLAIAPFSAEQARQHQEAWATHLKRAVIETNSIGMKLVLIPPGEFVMGSTQDEIKALVESATDRNSHDWIRREGPQHRVKLTYAFYLGTCEVTQKEYQTVMGNNPSHFSPGGAGKDTVRGQDTSHFPVENVSWDDANEFCRRLSASPAEQAPGRVYRLPTEAEWEWACRAGTTTPFHFGDKLNGQEANCKGPTAQVGSYASNPFGLYDMHGNVSEWCFDWYGAYGETLGGTVDPAGPETGSARVNRGGGWRSGAEFCRTAFRNTIPPTVRDDYLGLRVALVPSGQASEAASASRAGP